MCVLSLWQQYPDDRCRVIDTAPLWLTIRLVSFDVGTCRGVRGQLIWHMRRKWISSPWPGKRMRATVTSLEPFWKVEIFSTRSVQSERTNKVLGKQKMLGAAPSLLAAACRGRRSLLFGNNWKKLGVEVLLLEQVMMFKHVWTTLYFLSLTVKVNNYLMSDWKSQIYSLGCPKVPSGWGPFR